ncbi:MAG: phosphoadenosine phosphosulfate reductase family protein [Ktedonobacterales bacterium]|nr:phosphoadenosine phosphosulfate reductase family protein [Ktedonobacterales bacterium]
MSGLVHLPVVASDPAIDDLIAANAPLSFSSSGGKDSDAAALATSAYLDQKGHRGTRLVIHADLGAVEWATSLAQTQRLADHLGLELLVVRRAAGGLLERWQARWDSSVARYQQLRTVTLIMPWSAPNLRFCSSELKAGPISAALARRFPGQTIMSVVGLRRAESAARARIPIWQPDPRLTRVRAGTRGVSWYPIADWTTREVFDYHAALRFPMHEAYGRGASRVSCVCCILSSQADLRVAVGDPRNHPLYRELVALECQSGFAFQAQHWLGDLAPQLLDANARERLAQAQHIAQVRAKIEIRIPKHLKYTLGWPQVMPTVSEAELLAEVRQGVANVHGFPIEYATRDAILARYAELMQERPARAGGRE